MSTETMKKLSDLFDQVESEFPDKSTEFILEITAERAANTGLKHACDAGDIAEALYHQKP